MDAARIDDLENVHGLMNAMPERTIDDQALDYVLGSADAAERQRITHAMRLDTELAEAVRAWETRLMPLLQTVAPEAPPASLWRTLEDRTRARRIGLRAAPWLEWTGGVGLAAAGLYLLFAKPVSSVASIAFTTPDGAVIATAEIDTRHRLHLHPAAAMPSLPDSKVYELWIIPEKAAAPVAEAVLPGDSRAQVKLAEVDLAGTLAISIEPSGGSATGLPTGPVIASGPVLRH